MHRAADEGGLGQPGAAGPGARRQKEEAGRRRGRSREKETRGPERQRTRPEAGGRGRARPEALIAWRRDKPAASPCGPPAAVSPSESPAAKEGVMAEGQMRVPKEQKKPKPA